jgi:HAD superfamily phosphoserine phosphatase-like hydrolase
MITVIIPVLNESATIASVVAFAKKHPHVTEVVVVDDGSIDGTPEAAKEAGAKVITSTFLGKGASMQDGLRAAGNDIVLYLDGDLKELSDDLLEKLVYPIEHDEADFVKAKFTRKAGRVTILTAKPLLQTFFPELAWIEQPLGGIIAAKRSLLQRLTFENDYGVDVGLLLDVHELGSRIVQVDVGRIDHDSNPLDVLGDMATQVVRTILNRASRHGRLAPEQIHEVQEVERRSQAELDLVVQKLGRAERLALFDMDGTLLDGRFVVELARCNGKLDDLNQYLDHPTMPAEDRTRAIAHLFEGIARPVFEQTARHMPLSPGAVETVVELRKRGYRVGLVTDSFFVAAEVVRRRIFADFSVANVMRFRSGKASGHITLSPAFVHSRGCPDHHYCKRNVLEHMIDRVGAQPDQVVMVGDSDNDICLMKMAGRSVAYRPKSPAVAAAARYTIQNSLTEVLDILDRESNLPSPPN